MRLLDSISRRFILLTFLGYLAALLSSAVAVRLSSDASLEEMQNDALAEHSEAIASSVASALREITLQLGLLARQDDILHFVTGDMDDTNHVYDLLHRIGSPTGTISLEMFDFAGDSILQFDYSDAPSYFTRAETSTSVADVLNGKGEEPKFQIKNVESSNRSHLLISMPLVRFGSVEGVMVVELAFDRGAIFAKHSNIGRATLTSISQYDSEFVDLEHGQYVAVSKVSDTPILVVLLPDREHVGLIGVDIVRNVIYAVSIVLIIPFGFMMIVGNHSIVAPHRDLRRSKEMLRNSQRELRKLADIAERCNESIFTMDLNGRITWINRAFADASGYPLDEVLSQRPWDLLAGKDTDFDEWTKVQKGMQNETSVNTQILNYPREGKPFWTDVRVSPLFDQFGMISAFSAILLDISEARNAQEREQKAKAEVEFQAMHDPMTGLHNRRALESALDGLTKPEAKARVLIRIDLDHFKNVNDTLGHAAGDAVLIAVSDTILKHTTENDLAVRAGGDEFIILLGQGQTRLDAGMMAQRILHDIQKAMSFEGRYCRIGASFGIADAADGLVTNRELLLGADAALYTAKEQGRNCVVTYDAKIHDSVVRQRRTASEIERALERNEFEAFYQPQFDAQSLCFSGLEVLARWNHPERGILAPAEFLHVAEQRGLLKEIEAQVFERGIDGVKELNASGAFVPKVSFNVVANQLLDPELPERASRRDLGGTRVSFEVLESVLVEDQSSSFLFRIDALKDLGFGVEVDDFGSGHASIIGLMQMAPDAMKIDQRLVFPIVESQAAQRMVKAVLDIAKSLETRVIAEGVETIEHAAILAEMGCDTLQGYYFSRPISCKDLRAFLRDYRPDPTVLRCAQQERKIG
jgi:diguanylate cyclase (GGDEF)-like protein/PAS domain S-box-containing protein